MSKCFKPEYTNIEWEYDEKHFEKWTKGMTGFPIGASAFACFEKAVLITCARSRRRNAPGQLHGVSVAFGMDGWRKLTACDYRYIHNRCRMIVASFLSKDLLLDWRMGERWFMENLIDGDFA